MAPEVFISYSRKDRERVVPWIQRLQAAGVSLWIDEAGIEGAHLWGKEIVQAIDGCKMLMLMLSPASAASPQVVREVSLALDGAKQIFPLLLEPVVVPADLRYALAGLQHIELFSGEPEEKLRAVLRALSRLGVTAEGPKEPEEIRKAEEPARPGAPPAAAELERSSNLPLQLTRFIGREKEIADVKRLLSRASLLTLIGAGGCGKTRLAVQVARDLLEQYPDGVWLVELAALSEPNLAPQEVASALGVREEPGRALLQTLTDYLRSRSLLLILDNCEHLVAACAQLTHALLRGCRDLRVMATSREALGVPGEATWHVPTLSLPNPRRLPSMERLKQYEAVQLFLDRAILSQPAFALTEQNAPAVAQICWRLDGIPLAIELAAARVKVLSVEQIAARLDDAFRLLTAGSRTALPRQQTLRALIDWSYNLLSEPERSLLRRLSVFANGWTLAAAEVVCAGEGIDEFEVLDLLGQLMDKSLVVREEHTGQGSGIGGQGSGESADPDPWPLTPGLSSLGPDPGRYRLLETIRQYGAETLRASRDDAAVRGRHRDFYLAMAEEAEPHLTGAEQELWLERLEIDHDNLRAALGWAAETAEADSALRLGGALWRFWYVRGHLREGRERLEKALALPGAAECGSSRAKALNAAGALAHAQGEFKDAEAFHQESLSIARQHDDRQNIAFALTNLGNAALDQGNAEQASTLYQQALALWQELGNKRYIAALMNNLGQVELDAGKYDEAIALFRQSLGIKRELGDQRGIALSLNNLGDLAIRQGSHEQAAEFLEESRHLFRMLGDSYGLAMVLDSLAYLASEQGDLDRAAALYRECLSALVEVQNGQAIAGSLEGLAGVLAAQGDPAQAARLYGAAAALREAAGSPLPDGKRAEYDRKVTAAQAAVDAGVWDAGWAEGRKMSLAAAIATALRESAALSGVA
jgi:predicted ATPase